MLVRVPAARPFWSAAVFGGWLELAHSTSAGRKDENSAPDPSFGTMIKATAKTPKSFGHFATGAAGKDGLDGNERRGAASSALSLVGKELRRKSQSPAKYGRRRSISPY